MTPEILLNIPVITPFFAALLTLLYLVLTANVIRGRWRYRVGLGDGGQPKLNQLIRVHGNFAEYVPLALLLLLMVELLGVAATWVMIVGSLLLIGRVLHAIGLSRHSGTSAWRAVGVIATFASLMMSAVILLGVTTPMLMQAH